MPGKLLGVGKMIDTLRKVADKFPDLVGAALYREGQIEMTEAKRRTPVDTRPNQSYPYTRAPHPGQLRNSGLVHPPERRGQRISVTLSFGGAASDYAVHVHENPDAHHPIGQWKYLESVLDESASHMAARIARRVDLNKMKV